MNIVKLINVSHQVAKERICNIVSNILFNDIFHVVYLVDIYDGWYYVMVILK